MLKTTSIFITFFILMTTNIVKADELDRCPVSLVTVHKNIISEHTGKIIQKIYGKLNCEVLLTARPGRRAILEFNNKVFDGEVARFPVVEKHYSTEFIRSDAPLYLITGSIWGHATQNEIDKSKLGYVRGIVWQENYIQEHKGVGFNTYTEMYESYEKRLIHNFLAPDQHVFLENKRNPFKRSLSKKEQVFSAKAYHYLQAKYESFMKEFSKYIEQNDLFWEFKQ